MDLKTAAHGHFGRPECPWERVDATDELLAKDRKSKSKVNNATQKRDSRRSATVRW